MPKLDIRDLTVNYEVKGGVLQALAPVNLSMQGGDFVVALGASVGGRPHHRIGDRYQDLEELGRDLHNPAAV